MPHLSGEDRVPFYLYFAMRHKNSSRLILPGGQRCLSGLCGAMAIDALNSHPGPVPSGMPSTRGTTRYATSTACRTVNLAFFRQSFGICIFHSWIPYLSPPVKIYFHLFHYSAGISNILPVLIGPGTLLPPLSI